MLSITVAAALALAGCAAPKTKDLAADEAASAGERVASGQRRHITGDGEATTGEQATDGGKEDADIPAPVEGAPPLPEPSQAPAQQRYTVVVNEVPAQELLFSIARDADLEIDIIGSFDRKVTLNAVDETLPRLLERIAQQVPIRYELDEKAGYLEIAEDTPYLETYAVAYVDMQRSAQSRVTTATQGVRPVPEAAGPARGAPVTAVTTRKRG
jgi:general secretion pathway protein D